MTEKKITKIAVIALIFALVAISQTSAVLNIFNYTFHAGSNINIVDDGLGNVTISAMGGTGTDNTKLNKSGDIYSPNVWNAPTIYKTSNNNVMEKYYDDVVDGTYLYNQTTIDYDSNKQSSIVNAGDSIALYFPNNDLFFDASGIIINGINGISNNYYTYGLLTSPLPDYVTNLTIDRNLSNFTNSLSWVNNSTVDKNLANYTNTYAWVNNSTMAHDDTKLNTSGGTLTGLLIQQIQNNNDNITSKVYSMFENNTEKISIFKNGVQWWNVSNIYGEIGSIRYSTPGNFPGITFYNKSVTTDPYARADFYMFDDHTVGIRMLVHSTSGYSTTTPLKLDEFGNITIPPQGGIGNKPACFDSNGKLFRSTTSTC